MEISPGNNTTVFRMKRDFDSLLSDSGMNAVHRLDFSQTNQRSMQKLRSSSYLKDISGTENEKELQQKQNDAALRQKSADLVAAKTYIVQLESRIAEFETSNKRAKIELDKDTSLQLQSHEREKEKYEEMKIQLKFLVDKEQAAQRELEVYRKDLLKAKKDNEDRIMNYKKEKSELQDMIQKCREENFLEVSELKTSIRMRESELNNCTLELEEAKAQLQYQLHKSSDDLSKMVELEEMKQKTEQDELKIKELESTISRMESDVTVARTMKSQLNKFNEAEKIARQLTEENKYLRETQENIHLLKEQVLSLEQKLERSESRCVDYMKIQIENETMKKKLQKWELAVIPGTPNPQSPSELARRVAEFQASEAIMLEKQGQLQSLVRSSEKSLLSAQENYHSTLSQLTEEKNKLQQHADFIKRLQKKLLLVSKERDSYKRVIDSYENEVTVNVSAAASNRIQQLEQTIESYHKQIESLEAELLQKSNALVQNKTKVQQMELQMQHPRMKHTTTTTVSSLDDKTVLHLREKVENLEKALQKMEEENSILQARIEQRHLQGDFDPTKTKVLHFKMNPASLAQQQKFKEIVFLRQENEKLKQRIKLLEETGKTEDLTFQVEEKLKESGGGKEIDEMKAQLNSAELKNQRLMEAFQKTSRQFREIVYQLTGFRIDKTGESQFKLTNMYSESPDDYLIFMQSPDGEISMLATDYSASIPDLIDLHLQKHESIPAFLSSITLKLFSRQTICVS